LQGQIAGFIFLCCEYSVMVDENCFVQPHPDLISIASAAFVLA
jgi:hypothetical protein